VFETVLVEGRRLIGLARHMDRLADSLTELYGVRLDADFAARRAGAVAETATTGRSRLRILADPDGSLEMTVSPARVAETAPVLLTPFWLPGGLGRHKWRDRRLVDALAAEAPGTVPLLVDTDGLVLEAGYANVWIVERGALLTPPADGRILPGTSRAAVLAAESAASEQPIELVRLAAADSVFLTSSITGRHLARLAST
jgi:para-aminobenzoate synthetase/4-amino-4-deoxychorismate lyase